MNRFKDTLSIFHEEEVAEEEEKVD